MSANKPAATGSGEPQCQCWNYMSDGCDLHGNRPLPTPPASQPTVTLDRETFDNVVSKLKIVERCTPDREGKDLVLDALALLRAAEQK